MEYGCDCGSLGCCGTRGKSVIQYLRSLTQVKEKAKAKRPNRKGSPVPPSEKHM